MFASGELLELLCVAHGAVAGRNATADAFVLARCGSGGDRRSGVLDRDVALRTSDACAKVLAQLPVPEGAAGDTFAHVALDTSPTVLRNLRPINVGLARRRQRG